MKRFALPLPSAGLRVLLPITLSLFIGTQSTLQAQERKYVLATASAGGTYFPVGVALSTLIKIKLQPREGISLDAINSAGSGENIRLLKDGRAQLAILQGLYGYYARTGTGPLEADGPQTQLRSITMLWQNVEHLVTSTDNAKNNDVSALESLKGKPMAFGKLGSGTLGSTGALLSGLGADIGTDYTLFHDGYKGSLDALAKGEVAAASIPAGAPTSSIVDFMQANGKQFSILNFTAEQAKAADNGRELWTPYTIKAGTYPNQDNDIQTIAQPNVLVTHAAVSTNDIYLITKTIYENLPFLQGIHPATKAMAVEKALAGLPLPLHPGALKYYKEVGIDVPERLAKAPDACVCPTLDQLLAQQSGGSSTPQIASDKDIEATLSLFAPAGNQFDPSAFAGTNTPANNSGNANVASDADIQAAIALFAQSDAQSGFDPSQFTAPAATQGQAQTTGVASDAQIEAAIALFSQSNAQSGFDPSQFTAPAQGNNTQSPVASSADIQATASIFGQPATNQQPATSAQAPAAAAPSSDQSSSGRARSKRESIFLNFN